ncbi:MAG TPA: DUF6448 family protein [Terriglobales bacterium]|nr:DUF6448 family protein [Terriglobales bacterium]
MYRRAALLIAVVLLWTGLSFAHCDSLAGPVVQDARAALENGNLNPVLKWVRADDEAQVREAFARARAVRSSGSEARELADTWFFETVIRLHRAGEGASFTGLKPADALEPEIAAADRALQSGEVDDVAADSGRRVEAAVRRSFAEAVRAREHAGESVASGRRFVAAYVEYIHLVERAAALSTADAAHAPSAVAESHAH